MLSVSDQCGGSSVVSLACLISMCLVQRFLAASLLFGLWIILLPPCLLPFYFSCDKSVCQVPGPICVGGHGWKARVYQGLACSRRSVGRVRCSDDGERVKSYAEETRRKNEGRMGRVPSLFHFLSRFFFYCVKFHLTSL